MFFLLYIFVLLCILNVLFVLFFVLEPGVSLSLGATSIKIIKTGSSSSLHCHRINPPVGSELVPGHITEHSVACGLQTLKLYTLFYSLLECFINCDHYP